MLDVPAFYKVISDNVVFLRGIDYYD
jgi:hypothetical protein